NIPLDQLRRALPELRDAAGRGDLLVVCASGRRSADAAARLAGHGITAATLTGGTAAWSEEGHALDRPAACATRSKWAMERQVRLAAGTLVLLGLVLDLLVHPAFRFLSAGIAAGLVFSAVTNTCGMAAVLARLPHNRPRAADLDATLTALRERGAGGRGRGCGRPRGRRTRQPVTASGSRSDAGHRYGRSSGSPGKTSAYTSGSLRTRAERWLRCRPGFPSQGGSSPASASSGCSRTGSPGRAGGSPASASPGRSRPGSPGRTAASSATSLAAQLSWCPRSRHTRQISRPYRTRASSYPVHMRTAGWRRQP